MSRPSRAAIPTNSRERLRYSFNQALPLRQIYPQVMELRVEFEFQDGSPQPPSQQSYVYFPAARGFFRYACPCHSCDGEFDLSGRIAELAAATDKPRQSRRLSLACAGQRTQERSERAACPIHASIGISLKLITPE